MKDIPFSNHHTFIETFGLKTFILTPMNKQTQKQRGGRTILNYSNIRHLLDNTIQK
jgi:hypothetical protein